MSIEVGAFRPRLQRRRAIGATFTALCLLATLIGVATLGALMGREIHALQLKTLTPEEAAA